MIYSCQKAKMQIMKMRCLARNTYVDITALLVRKTL